MNFIHSIKFRFTLWYLAVLGVLLILLGSGVYITLSRDLRQNLDDALRTRAEQLSRFRDIIAIVAGGTFEEEIGELISFYFYSGGELMYISHKESRAPASAEQIDSGMDGQSTFSILETDAGVTMRVYAIPFTPDNPRISPGEPSRPGGFQGKLEIHRAVLVLARPLGDTEEALQRLLHIMIIAFPLILILAGGGGVFLARRALAPVERIANTAREIEETDLSRRVDVKTRDELGSLAGALNQMIERLERAFERQKQFTGDASHELRAPLAVIRAEATLALQKSREAKEYRRSIETVSQEADHMAGVINQLLTLARADAGKEHVKFEPIDLAELIKETCSDVEELFREKGLGINVNVQGAPLVNGDRRSLRRLLLNLLNNAIRYTPGGGDVSATLREETDTAVVSVSDTGIGIPSNELPHIFKRFYRVDKARSRSEGGSGLGLAICRHIVDIHDGGIEAESQVGKGSAFHVRLPRIR